MSEDNTVSEMTIDNIGEDIEVKLGNEESLQIEDSNESIVFLYYNDNLVMIFDSKRKAWAFPSGQREKGETTLECAIRETFEKAGAVLENAIPIGYYFIVKNNITFKTAIFFGKIRRFETRPEWSEADLVKLFDNLPQEILDNKIYNMVIDYIRTKY